MTGFAVKPPHVALCAITRLLTSAQPELHLDATPKFVARFVRFCLRQRFETASLQLPSLNRLLSLLQDTFGENGIAIGDYCRDTLSGLTSIPELARFFSDVKRDLEGQNGVSPLLQALISDDCIRIPSYSPFGIFLRQCVASFEEMKFEEISDLASGMAQYCPSMLDEEPFSPYMADSFTLEKQHEALMRDFQQGKHPMEIDKQLEQLQSLSRDNPSSYLMQHDLTLLRKDVTDAIQTLHRYCSQAFGTSNRMQKREVRSPEGASEKLHAMSLKMASLQSAFDHVEKSRAALDDAFEFTRKLGDEKAMLSCLVLLVQVLLQSPPEIEKDEVSLETVNRLLERCCTKARQIKLPHILAFSVTAKSLLALKHGIIQGHKASAAEVHRLVTTSERNLRQLRDYVSAATVVLNVRTRPRRGEEYDFETYKLFLNALNIFDPSMKDIDANISSTMNQLVSTMQMYVALSWKRVGHHSLGLLSALSVELAFGYQANLTDRAEALAHVAMTQADRKGHGVGHKMLSCTARMSDIKDQLPLKAAERYMTLETSLPQSSAWSNRNMWPLQQASMQSFAAWSASQVPLCADTFISRESLITRSLMSIEKTWGSAEQIRMLGDVCERGKLTAREPEVLLLHTKLDDHQDNMDLTAAFISEAGAFLEDAVSTTHTAESTFFFCKALFKSQRSAAQEVEKILTTLLPFILSECTLSLQAEVMVLLWNVKCAALDQEAPEESLISVLERAVHISILLGDWSRVDALCSDGQRLIDEFHLPLPRFAFSKALKRLCLSHGGERSGISFQGTIWPEDAMDLD